MENVTNFIKNDKNGRNDNGVYAASKAIIIKQNNIEGLYLLKSGSPDGKISKIVPNFIHAVFPIEDIMTHYIFKVFLKEPLISIK